MTTRLLRAVAAITLGAAMLGIGGPAAQADPNDQTKVGGVQQADPNPALVNPTAAVRLSITKYLGGPTGDANNGTALSPAPARSPLEGVNFDVFMVYTDPGPSNKVDLTTNTGQEAAAKINGYKPTADDFDAGQFTVSDGTTYYIGKTPTQTEATAADGTATFTRPNGVGLYLVRENLATSGTVTNGASTIPKNEITQAAPFFVSLPMTHPTSRDTWMYDVYVYPKNQRDTITKSVQDKGIVTTEGGVTYGTAGKHAYSYTLTSSITDGTGPLGMYAIYDDLDPSLTLNGVSLKLSGGTSLAAGTDYNVYTATAMGQNASLFDPPTPPSVANGPAVAIVFTGTGRGKLEGARDQDVVTTLNVTAGARDADGVVENKTSFVPNSAWWDQYGTPGVDPNKPTDGLPPSGTGIQSTEVLTRFGDLAIAKTDPVGGAPLAGAEFNVYRSPTSGQCSPADMVAANVVGKPSTTDTSGKASFVGLQTSDWYDGGPQSTPLTYCLVETKAPVDYNLDAQPHMFTLPYGSGTPATVDVTVKNEKKNFGNELPLTGGPGIALLSILGALLIAAGLGYYVVSQRRRR